MDLSKIVVLLSIFASVIHGEDVLPPMESLTISCPKHEEPSPNWCCPQTCNIQNNSPCLLLCTFPPKCACKRGFVRIFQGGPCISDSICRWIIPTPQQPPILPSPVPRSPPPPPPITLPPDWTLRPICPEHEEVPDFVPCSEGCNKDLVRCIWAQPNTMKICFCQAGYSRLFKGGPCIPDRFCHCPDNQQTYQCEPCVTTCQQFLQGPRFCPLICRETGKCYCKPGWLFDRWGRCVPSNICTTEQIGPIG